MKNSIFQSFRAYFLAFLFIFIPLNLAFADYTEDQNNGSFAVDLRNVLGTEPSSPFTENMNVPSGGIASVNDNNLPGYISTSNITPSSFSTWKEIKINYLEQVAGEVKVKPTNCDGSDIPGFTSFVAPIAGKINISGVSNSITCIKAKIQIDDSSNSSPSPKLTGITVTWTPKSVFLLRLNGDSTQKVGNTVSYGLDYSVSYVDALDTIAFVEIPEMSSGITGFDPSYQQNLEPTFNKASNGGTYTATAITVKGINIPAKSIYWDLGTLKAGATGSLKYSLNTANGWQNGTSYSQVGSIAANNAQQVNSSPYLTLLTGVPAPIIDKGISGAITLNNETVAVDAAGYGPEITYSIEVKNDGSNSGLETIFNPSIKDNLSEVFSKLNSICGMSNSQIENAIIVNGSTLTSLQAHSGSPTALNTYDSATKNLYWNPKTLTNLGGLNDIGANAKQTVSFKVTFDNGSGCFNSLITGITTINNVAYLDGDNISEINDPAPLKFKAVDTNPTGIFAKGDRVFGTTQIQAGKDDNKTKFQPFNDLYSYKLYITNTSAVRLDNIILADMIPLGIDFTSASVPEVYNSTIYYNTSPKADPNILPDYNTTTGALGGSWTTTVPSNPADVNWVAFSVPCINSQIFPSTSTATGCYNSTVSQFVPSSITADINAKIVSPGDPSNDHPQALNQCSVYEASNVGHFYAYRSGADITNNATVAIPTPLTALDSELTHISPAIGSADDEDSFSSKFTQDVPLVVAGSNTSEYELTVVNSGKDTIQNGVVKINIPKVDVNGVSTSLNLTSGISVLDSSNNIVASTLDYSHLPDYVNVNLGNLPTSILRKIRFAFSTPKGVFDLTSFEVSAQFIGSDDNSCSTINRLFSTQTTFESSASLEVRKSRDEALINTSGNIHYQLSFKNTGETPTTRTFVVDRIPDKTIFEEAYTSPASDPNGNSFSCVGCQVYFACKNETSLPAELSPLSPISPDQILSTFVPGIEIIGSGDNTISSGSGKWIPPLGYCSADNVLYVAFLVDNNTLTPSQFAVSGSGKVGIRVKNDNDGSGPLPDGSATGTLIKNSSAIVSKESLQAIGNQVLTTVLPDPGLVIDKTSSIEAISSGKEFDWYVDYYNNSGSSDTQVVITDTLPYGTELVALEHTWNSNTGGGPAAGAGNILSHPAVSITQPGDGTTKIIVTVADSDNSPTDGLREADLAPRQGGRIKIRARITSQMPTGSNITNNAEGCYENAVNAGNPYCIYDDSNVIVRNPDLNIVKLVNQSSPLAGEQIVYTLLLSNKGQYEAPDVSIKDRLAAGLCFVSTNTLLPNTWTVPSPTLTGAGCPASPNNPAGCDCSSLAQTTTGITTITWNGIDSTSYNTGVIPANSEEIQLSYNVKVGTNILQNTKLNNTVTTTTSLTEDTNYPSTQQKDVITPLPDIYVTKNALAVVSPGEIFNYKIQYGNASRQAATGVYLIDTLPDLKLLNISAGNSEKIYCNSTAVAFNPIAPLTNGWSASCDTSSIQIAIVPTITGTDGALNAESGPYAIEVTASATPRAGGTHLAGTSLVNSVTGYSNNSVCNDETDANETDDTENTCSNNTASVTTKTPGFDLYLEKTGSIEGSSVGTAPGATLTYTIRYGNQGSDPVCNVKIKDTLPNTVTLISQNFDVINLKKQSEVAAFPLDSNDLLTANEITSPVTVTYDGTEWTLGGANVCLPSGTYGEFKVEVRINDDILDSTNISNTASIDIDDVRNCENADPREDLCTNNTDSSSVIVYRSDVKLTKQGTSCGSDNDCSSQADNNLNNVSPNELINWKISYDNIGNISAEDTIIEETIPTGTCYKVGSMELAGNQPVGTTLQYSNDSKTTWTYSPVADVNGTDCAVTNFRLVFSSALPAPANFWTQSITNQFSTNTFDNNIIVTDDKVRLNKSIYSGGMDNLYYAQSVYDSKGNLYTTASPGVGSGINFYNGKTDTLVNLDSIVVPGFTSAGTGYGRVYVNKSDKVDIAWHQDNAIGSNRDVLYYSPTTGTTVNVSNLAIPGFVDGGHASSLYGEYDSLGNLHLIWIERNSITSREELLYYSSATGTAVDLSIIPAAGFTFTGGYETMYLAPGASGDMNVAWIAYSSGNSDVLFYNSALGTVTDLSEKVIPTFTDGGNSISFSLKLKTDALGNAYVTWFENNSSNSSTDVLYYSSSSGNVINLSTQSIPGFTQGGFASIPDLVTDNSGNVYIAWSEQNLIDSTYDLLFYSSLTGTIVNLSDSSIANFSDGGEVNIKSIYLDSLGHPHIYWTEKNALDSGNYAFIYYNIEKNEFINISAIVNTTIPLDPGAAFSYEYFDDTQFDKNNNIKILVRAYNNATGYFHSVLFDGATPDKVEVLNSFDYSRTASGGKICIDTNNKLEVLYGTIEYPTYLNPAFTYWTPDSGNTSIDHITPGFSFDLYDFENAVSLISNNQKSCVYSLNPEINYSAFRMIYGVYAQPSDITTQDIEPTCSTGLAKNWGKVSFTNSLPDGTNLIISVLDNTGAVIPGYENIYNTNGFYDISGIPSTTVIKLKATFEPKAGNPVNANNILAATPILEDWKATYSCEDSPSFEFVTRVKTASDLNVSEINNVASISTTTPEVRTSNNTSSYNLFLTNSNLNLVKTVDYTARLNGESLQYTIQACNAGSNTAVNGIVTDILPSNFTLGAAAGCINNSGILTCNIGDLEVGQCSTITVSGTITGAIGGETLNNEACIESNSYDTDLSDNCDSVQTIVDTLANVWINKTGDASANLNGLISYNLTYGNNGNSVASDVAVVEPIPSETCLYVADLPALGIEYSTDGSNYTYTPVASTNGTDCNITHLRLSYASLAVGQTETFNFKLRVKNNSSYLVSNLVIPNLATIATTTSEVTISDNTDDHNVPVTPGSLAELGGRVFIDQNENVVFNSGIDLPIPGAKVYLYGYDIYNTVYGPNPSDSEYYNVITQDYVDSLITLGIVSSGTTPATLSGLNNYQILSNTVTDSNGDYVFGGLKIGTYNVFEVQPVGYKSTGSNAGQFTSVADDSPVLSPGHGQGTVEGGIDKNRITRIELQEGELSSQNNFGENTGSIGNLVFSDLNSDGVFNVGDVGIAGVEISLFKDVNQDSHYDSGDILIAKKLTDGNGSYVFNNLLLDDGDGDFEYLVVVTDSNSVLTGSTHTTGTPGIDNNSQDQTGYGIILDSNATENLTADFGFFGKASLGDYVWYDLDHDGVQSATEKGVSGVVVNLLSSDGSTVISSTVTDGNGHYLFNDITPENYIVEFVTPNTGSYQFSGTNLGDNSVFDSDANTTTGRTAIINLAPGENERTIDAGVYIDGVLPASLGNRVWFDADNNGKQDLGELGVSGVKIELYNLDNTLLATSFTDATGNYNFGGLAPNSYYVKFVPSSGYTIVGQDLASGDDTLDSDADLSGKTASISLISGQTDSTIDLGLYASITYKIGDKVWFDNGNGTFDGAENGIPGIKVNLLNSSGDVISSTYTDSSGNYLFLNLLAGNYEIEFELPSGYEFTLPNIGGDESVDSDANAISGRTGIINLSSDRLDLDAGLKFAPGVLPAKIGNYIWEDSNSNGIQDLGENEVPDVVVNLYNAQGILISTAISDLSGNYQFDNLAPGGYYIEFVVPNGYSGLTFAGVGNDSDLDSSPEPSTGRTGLISLATGEDNQSIDAGLLTGADGKIGNLVFRDNNHDGIYNSGDQLVSGVTVELYRDINGDSVIDPLDELVRTRTTISNGEYLFENLPVDDGTGSYKYLVRIPTAPSGLVLYQGGVGLDNNSQNASGYPVTLTGVNKANYTADFGYEEPRASLGNFVWNDDGDGSQEVGENGISGITVKLYDSLNNLIQTKTTGVNGDYLFSDLVPGSYYVVVEERFGYVFAPQNADSDDLDSDVNSSGKTQTVTLIAGENNIDLDIGFVPLVSTSSIGDLVWYDGDHDGVKDGIEPGVGGVQVKLYNQLNNALLATTVTNADGQYLFEDLPAGSYFVEFNPSNAYTFSIQDQAGDDNFDSDPDILTRRSAVITLAENSINRTIDAGIYLSNGSIPSSIGTTVWLDFNNNGLQDSTETGVPGVKVYLLSDSNAVIAVDTTDINGNYNFSGLPSGNYRLSFEPPAGYGFTLQDAGDDNLDSDANTISHQTNLISLSAGQTLTTVDVGLTLPVLPASLGDYVWYDSINNSIQDANETGVPGVSVKLYNQLDQLIATTTTDVNGKYLFTNLVPGNYYVIFEPKAGYKFVTKDTGAETADSDADSQGKTDLVNLASGNNYLDLDAGLVMSNSSTIPASLGTLVWLDLNYNGVKDESDPIVPGVVVNLYDSFGVLIANAVTDANGNYHFANLVPGNYILEFIPPEGYEFTQYQKGGDASKDNNANQSSGRTVNITLVSGENKQNVDAGLFEIASNKCKGVSYTRYQFTMDGSAHSLLNTVQNTLNLRKSAKSCSKLSSKANKKILTDATTSYNTIWNYVWTSLPGFEGISSDGCNCSNLDSSATIKLIRSEEMKIYRTLKQILNNSCFKKGGKIIYRKYLNLLKVRDKSHQSFITSVSGYPNPILVCKEN